MRDALRYYLVNYPSLWIVPAVLLALIVLPFVENTDALRDSMALRWQESQGKTPAQIAARQESERQAAELRARQAQAEAAQRAEAQRQEAARQRQAAEFARLLAEWRTLSEPPLTKGKALAAGAKAAIDALVDKPELLEGLGITRADAANGLNCLPKEQPPMQGGYSPSFYSKAIRADRQMAACMFFFRANVLAGIDFDVQATLMVGTFLRLVSTEFRSLFPLPALFAYTQAAQWQESLRRAKPLVPPIGPAVENGRVNPTLFILAMPPLFIGRLTDTAQNEERDTIERESYPAMRQLFESANRLLAACKAAGKTDCLAN